MKQTLHLSAEKPEQIIQGAELLRSGRLVAFATETVYGLGANALSAEAVAGIFEAKQRPSWDPLIVHIASVAQLRQVAVVPPPIASRLLSLASAFWPGPLTLLLPRSAAIPDAVTAGRELVGVRIPSHPAALALLREANLPIAAPSANRFGHTSPTTAAHVLADLEGRIDAVLDAGPTSVGVESTVLDPTQTPMVLYRPGAVTAKQLTAATGVEVTVYEPARVVAAPESLPSPGVGIRHYAPRATLMLVEPWVAAPEVGAKAGVMLPEGWQAPAGAEVYAWGRWEDLDTLAARLFAGLRELDDRGVEVIVCPLPAAGGVGDALRDRLRKAAMAK
jgi:L-threonylcarbamoyladenylate synthase